MKTYQWIIYFELVIIGSVAISISGLPFGVCLPLALLNGILSWRVSEKICEKYYKSKNNDKTGSN